jgi:hypothetical protein
MRSSRRYFVDWIKVEISTPDKPEIYQMASELGLDPDAVLGKLIRVWVWADMNIKPQELRNDCVTKNNYDRNCDVTGTSFIMRDKSNFDMIIDRITNTKNFADAMLRSGWLIENDGCYELPNFERHNGKSTKTRLLNAERAKRHRGKNSVTLASRLSNDCVTKNNYKSVTREEKKRIIIKPLTPNDTESQFDTFWNLYPRKIGKENARKSWNRTATNQKTVTAILSALPNHVESPQWRKDNGQFIPHPATWLNQRRWEDVLTVNAHAQVKRIERLDTRCTECKEPLTAQGISGMCTTCYYKIQEARKNIKSLITGIGGTE